LCSSTGFFTTGFFTTRFFTTRFFTTRFFTTRFFTTFRSPVVGQAFLLTRFGPGVLRLACSFGCVSGLAV
jgi:hypothetical protein